MGVTTDLQIKNPEVTVLIDRDRAAAVGDHREPARAHALRRVRLAPGVDDLHADQRVLGRDGVDAAVRARRARPRTSSTSARRRPGRCVPLSTIARLQRTVGPLSINHSGQLPSVTISFNVAPNVALEPGGRRSSQNEARQVAAADDQLGLRRHGRGIPDLRSRARRPARALGVRDLRRARDPVRELHPSDHDSVGHALRRGRRAPRAPGHAQSSSTSTASSA